MTKRHNNKLLTFAFVLSSVLVACANPRDQSQNYQIVENGHGQTLVCKLNGEETYRLEAGTITFNGAVYSAWMDGQFVSYTPNRGEECRIHKVI